MSEASTVLYFVRHAESRYVEGQERERGLTEQGHQDAGTVASLLHGEQIHCSILALTGERWIRFRFWQIGQVELW
ncbi:hypothetical protein [Paenibacillus amylolyticus]|jgi:phosphohistidine phosphatase SixA|uniref:hypothetical protein n=1 Tax=Paenibacillus amylolyticus TaxID=1451 RepID=UPI001F0D250E|nr:hypothetical protein [Paenibacillus amylolyticus]